MVVLEDPRIIYLAIPKTASGTIVNLLLEQYDGKAFAGHHDGPERMYARTSRFDRKLRGAEGFFPDLPHEDLLGMLDRLSDQFLEHKFSTYKVVCHVRHHWDRMWAWYWDGNRKHIEGGDNRYMNPEFIDDWIRRTAYHKSNGAGHTFGVDSELYGRWTRWATDVLLYEDHPINSLDKFLQANGLKPIHRKGVGHEHKTIGWRPHYTEYYDKTDAGQKTKLFLAEKFKPEIEKYGYVYETLETNNVTLSRITN